MSDYAQSFVEHLELIKKTDPAGMATLRHSLAFEPGSYDRAFRYVERFVKSSEDVNSPHRRALYAVAALFAKHPIVGSRSFANAFGMVMRLRGSQSIELRFLALIGADPENLVTYLRQAITLIATESVGIDYAKLLQDLSIWLNPRLSPYSRDRLREDWARDFYRAVQANTAEDDARATNNLLED